MSLLWIGSDHAGVPLKNALMAILHDIEWKDVGTYSAESVDYPDYARKVAHEVSRGGLGLLICGSGIGMSIAANKVSGVRAAVVDNPVAARLAREHNHANVLCLGARFLAPDYAAEIVRAWLQATPSQDIRHTRRVAK